MVGAYMRYYVIVAGARKEVRQLLRFEEELDGIRRKIEEVTGMLVDIFKTLWAFSLLILKYHLLDHVVEHIQITVYLSILDSILPLQVTLDMK